MKDDSDEDGEQEQGRWGSRWNYDKSKGGNKSNKDNRKEDDIPGANKKSKELQWLKQRFHNNDMNMEGKSRTTTQEHRPGRQLTSELGRLHSWGFRLQEPGKGMQRVARFEQSQTHDYQSTRLWQFELPLDREQR
eukprot:6668487-Heterocapsa_arctica.AAC.1